MAFFAALSALRMGSIALPSVMSPDWRTTSHGHTYGDTPPPRQSLRLNRSPLVDEATEHNALALFLELPPEAGFPPPAQPSGPELEQPSAINTPQAVSSIGPTSHGRYFQEGDASFLDNISNYTGDVQASPPHEWNTQDSPINVAVEEIQEAGYPTRLTALETMCAFRATINQQEQLSALREQAEDRMAALAFFTLVHISRRNPYANIQEALGSFNIVTTFIHEHVMQSLDLVGAA